MPENELNLDLIDLKLETQNKNDEDLNEVSQVSPDIISFNQLYSIETIFNKLNNRSLTIPDFQRKWGLWSLKNQSLFIESIILQLPIPSIVVFTDTSFKLKVIDWLQRTSTIFSFLKDEFELSWLSQIKTENFNGFVFSQLPEDIKYQIWNSTLSVITVQCNPGDERANATYYEIFRRLNQWWLSLTPQEIRNALYKGNFLEFLRWNEETLIIWIRNHEIWNELYKIRWNYALNCSRERDVELLLRIFAIAETQDDTIDKKMWDFLNKYLETANKKSTDDLESIWVAFYKAMDYVVLNNLIQIFKDFKIKQSMWYNMLLSVIISFYLKNPDSELPERDFKTLVIRNDFPDASSDTWNIRKIKIWREIFDEFILP